MRLWPIVLIIALSFVSSHEAIGGEFNLSPVVFYESEGEDYTLNMLGPIFAFSSQSDAVRPVFYRDEERTDILFPLGQSTKTRGLFFPLYRSVQEEHHSHRTLFPAFYGRYRDTSYGGLFPLYGSLSHRFGYDHAQFVLWPVYSTTTIGDTDTYYILWPVFSYSRDREFKIFPLYGYEKSRGSRHDFALWPIFHRKRGKENMDAVLPLFLYARGDSYKNISVIWPFFTYSRDFRANHTSTDCPWPLIRFAKGGYEQTRIFPFYHTKIIPPTYSVKTVLWPLYRKELNFDKNSNLRREKTSVLILSRHSHEISLEGEETYEKTLWPVWHHKYGAHESSWYVPWIFPFRNEGFRRNWLPVLTLAHGEKSNTSSFVDILWHTIFYEHDERTSRFSFSFLCSYAKSEDSRELGFFFDVLKVRIP
ncbi:MAG TPA: hypothetical protein PLU81_01290 [Deltaproteobacteria bacterium]|nr:hypothetical protein [Deltaproteobacteria bacterium]